jgi:hypothetical protein
MTIPSAAGEGLHNLLPLTFRTDRLSGALSYAILLFVGGYGHRQFGIFDPRPLEILSKRTQFGKSSPAFRHRFGAPSDAQWKAQ